MPRTCQPLAVGSSVGRDVDSGLSVTEGPNDGRLVFGAGIGVLTWIIRSWGGYPDGVAFAVLLMNLAVPLIDRWTVPKIHGQPH